MNCDFGHESDEVRWLPDSAGGAWVCAYHFTGVIANRSLHYWLTGIYDPAMFPRWDSLTLKEAQDTEPMSRERMYIWAGLLAALSSDLLKESKLPGNHDSKLYAASFLQEEASDLLVKAFSQR